MTGFGPRLGTVAAALALILESAVLSGGCCSDGDNSCCHGKGDPVIAAAAVDVMTATADADVTVMTAAAGVEL